MSVSICSKVREDHENYSEEEQLIGKAENCDENQIEIISISRSESSHTKNQQQTLETFFDLKPKKTETDEQTKTQQKPTDLF